MAFVIGFWAVGYFVQNGLNGSRLIVLSLSLAYIYVAFAGVDRKRWAVFFILLVSLLIFIRWVPMVTLNFYMFLDGHELYLDSPGTILVVIPLAVIFAFPSLIMIIAIALNFRKLILFFRNA